MLIEQRNIRLNQRATDWKEDVILAAAPMVESGYITEDYAKAIIAGVEELGPYIVIAPGLALSHARPDTSVHKSGLGLMTLKEPVCFGSENDPVTIIITLAACDSHSHIEVLQKVAERLCDPQTVQNILMANSPEEIDL